MKKLLLPILILSLWACNNTPETPKEMPEEEIPVEETPEVEEKEEVDEEETSNDFPAEGILGSYVGMFEAEEYDEKKKPSWANVITVSLDAITGDQIKGHSVVAGNDRPFYGTIQEGEEGSYNIQVEEPGDDRYDGKFTFSVYPKKELVIGFWIANDKNLAVTKRSYNLKKKDFKYDPNLELSDIYYIDLYGTYNDATGESEFVTEQAAAKNPSVEKLTKKDVENMNRGDLEVMRNGIYARHGYSFKNRKMRYVFNFVDWYMPVSTDIRDQLTQLEKENIDLIKRYEQHAERYYDVFGR